MQRCREGETEYRDEQKSWNLKGRFYSFRVERLQENSHGSACSFRGWCPCSLRPIRKARKHHPPGTKLCEAPVVTTGPRKISSKVPNLLDSVWIFTGRLVPRTLPPKIGAAVFSRLKRGAPV